MKTQRDSIFIAESQIELLLDNFEEYLKAQERFYKKTKSHAVALETSSYINLAE